MKLCIFVLFTFLIPPLVYCNNTKLPYKRPQMKIMRSNIIRPIYDSTIKVNEIIINDADVTIITINEEEELNNVTVLIYGPNRNPRCGGVIVSDSGLILTAAHCVLDRFTQKPDKFNFVEIQDEIYRIEVTKLSRKQDLALLQITDKYCITITAVKLAEIEPEEKDDVCILSGYAAGVKYMWSCGIIAKKQHKASSGEHTILITAYVWYGSSGSPAFDIDGELIGIVSSFGPSGPAIPTWANIIHIQEIKKFLKDKI